MTIESLIKSAQALLNEANRWTPALQSMVNDVRAFAHVNGQLTAEHEQVFQKGSARFQGFMVKPDLTPLPTTGPDGKPVAPLQIPVTPPSGPTVQEYVKAGYDPRNYPPTGYSACSSPQEIAEAIVAYDDSKAEVNASIAAGLEVEARDKALAAAAVSAPQDANLGTLSGTATAS